MQSLARLIAYVGVILIPVVFLMEGNLNDALGFMLLTYPLNLIIILMVIVPLFKGKKDS